MSSLLYTSQTALCPFQHPAGYEAPSAAAILTTKTRLSVCKDGGVVALEAAVNQLLGAAGVDVVLLRVHVEQVVVGEGLVFAQDHLRLPGHHIGTNVTSFYLLPGQLRTNPTAN